MEPDYKQHWYGAVVEDVKKRQEEILLILKEVPNLMDMLDHPQFLSTVEEDAVSKSTPKSYRQATNSPNAKGWMASMKREMDAHSVNGTFKRVPRPTPGAEGKKHVVLRCVWKYRTKTQQMLVTNKKSRLCVDGRPVMALPWEVFAGTPAQEVVFLVFALAAYFNVSVIAGDVPAAYVQAKMPDGDTLFYITQPPGFVDPDHLDDVFLLLKCLYGLPQSGHQWN